MKFGFRSRTIFLAREILSAPCVAGRVRAHEREHADVDDRVLDAFLRALERTLPHAIVGRSPALGPAPAEAEALFRRTVEDALGTSLERDYRAMSGMIFGDVPELPKIIEALTRLEATINTAPAPKAA